MLYVIKHKIVHPNELDFTLVVDEVCPGETTISVLNFANRTRNNFKQRKNVAENLKNLPLYEIMKLQMNNKHPINPAFQNVEKYLQRKNDIVNLYKSLSH